MKIEFAQMRHAEERIRDADASNGIQFSYMKNAKHTIFMQFHKYRKLHERSIISDFSYMEIV